MEPCLKEKQQEFCCSLLQQQCVCSSKDNRTVNARDVPSVTRYLLNPDTAQPLLLQAFLSLTSFGLSLPCTGVASSQVLGAVLGTTIPEGHQTVKRHPKEGHEDDEASGGHVYGEAEGMWCVQPREEETEGRSQSCLELPHETKWRFRS